MVFRSEIRALTLLMGRLICLSLEAFWISKYAEDFAWRRRMSTSSMTW